MTADERDQAYGIVEAGAEGGGGPSAEFGAGIGKRELTPVARQGRA